ncbi:hypothetical protein EJ08DRAFT_648958 [Tothia fuscella]|uniref:Uncharacterized protein n=1 Tax=Tothia fuscella TaxID=1048955 RepID=A0A9P4NSN4_9PEZI|nr:hypothetical protein EJ08DRAFT_648958 [Tothia fuscella]
MSATQNENSNKSVSNQQGQFGSHPIPSEPLTTQGHKPGVIASKADAAPEFHAQTLPAGTVPSSKTFQPQNDAVDPDAVTDKASETLTGSTSSELHTGYGHPGSGQTRQELHDGSHERAGLEGVGATGELPTKQ